MLRLNHRDSKDIDLFVTDPQLLGYLSPRLAGEAVWGTEDYDESGNALKLRYDEGEIDIIVAAPISDLPTDIYEFDGVRVCIEHPAEIILKKLVYRDSGFKPRDVFDTAAVLSSCYGVTLRGLLGLASGSKTVLLDRIASISNQYLDTLMAELEIRPDWQWIVPQARQMVIEMMKSIPEQVD
jgi:hypothetical protein